MNVTVVDSIMGSGKSTWARKYMNDHPEKRWWYVTPYNMEVDKTVEICGKINMRQPEENAVRAGSSKTDHLLKLIDEGANIALTHALFLIIQLTPELKKKIQEQNYSLIIDEVLDVVRPTSITTDDIQVYTAADLFEIDPTDKHIIWKNFEYTGKVEDLIPLTKTGTLFHTTENDNALIWTYNQEVFEAFQSIHILTYYFIGSRMYHYMKWHDFDLSMCETDGNTLIDHCDRNMEIKHHIQTLMQIEYSNLNDVGSVGRYTSRKLSKNWYEQRRNDEAIAQLFRNAYNFLHNKCHATVGETLYTTFKSIAANDPLKNYKKAFLSCTTMATNEYSDRKYLAYLVNMFENPAVKNFFSDKGITYNEDIYALNSMMQWIWRSRIRKNESIRLYVPSIRMRELLEKWFLWEE